MACEVCYFQKRTIQTSRNVNSMSNPTPAPDWADLEWSNELAVLRARGENQDLEYMEGFPRQASELGKEIAAFASSNQGMILIGVSNTGDLVGLEDALNLEGRDKLLRRIEGICRGTVKPSITPTVKFAIEDGRAVLIVLIPKGPQPVYYSNNIPYVRHITESRPAEPHEVIELVRAWLRAAEVPDEQSNPITRTMSRLAPILRDVIIYSEEASERMLNPWLDLWRAQFAQAASDLRELSVDDTAIQLGLPNELSQLISSLENVANLRLHLGSGPEVERLIADILAQSKSVWESHIASLPLAANTLRSIKSEIVRTARKLHSLCERASTVLERGRIDEFQSEASGLGLILLQIAQFNLDFLHPGLAERLRNIARPLHLVETRRVYMDGGKSVQAIADTVHRSCAELETVVATLSN